jgi:mannosyltransferase OCH1-like enzyme
MDFTSLIKKSYAFDPIMYIKDSRWRLLEELFVENFDNVTWKKDYNTLPKKIHQIWLGSPIPKKYKEWGESWKKLNPEWEYRLWTDEDVYELELPNMELYNSLSNYGAKSDILRYNILNKFGGVYIDTDYECLKSFDSLTYLSFFTGIGYPAAVELYVGLIGSVPGHPIIKQVADEVNAISKDIVVTEILNATSSYFFTREFFKVIQQYEQGVVAFPTQYMYPFPNDRDHHLRKGKDFILDCSYAIHYWEVSWGIENGRTDWIQGEKFKNVADFIYAPKKKHKDDYSNLQNTFTPADLKQVNIIYTHTFYVKQLFEILNYLKGQFVIITHNADDNVDDSYVIPENVIKWYAQNVNVENPKIESIPIGLENNMWDKKNGKKMFLNEQLKQRREYKNLVYMNHDVTTNPSKRAFLYDIFAGKSWVTSIKGKNGYNVKEYYNNLYNHKFVICPEGNGIDTHRTWEALYMGTIPIEKKNINNQHYTDLPICFVNDWSDLTEEFLNTEWTRIKGKRWNMPKLYFEYWRDRIRNTKI